MLDNEVSYYFGRLNIITAYKGQEKVDFIMRSLLKNNQITEREYKWGFFNVSKIQHKDNDYIFGILVKYKEQFDEEVVNENENVLATTIVPKKTLAKSNFVLHPKTGIIAYHPVINRINNSQFKNLFCKLIEESYNNLFIDAEIQSVDDEMKIFDAIKSLDKITSLVINLHPSNPSNRDRWKKTDEKLQAMNVENYSETYSGKNGIIIDENGDAYGNIIMAGDGYGEARINGIKGGKQVLVSTKKIPIRVVAPSEGIEIIVNKLSPVFNKIFERFKKHEN